MGIHEQALLELQGDPPILESQELEGFALTMHERARSLRVSAMVRAAGLRVRRVVPEGNIVESILIGRTIYAQPRSGPEVIAHELAHHLVRKTAHSHGDVWALTLALLVPLATAIRLLRSGRLTMGGLRAAGVQGAAWAVKARLEWLLSFAKAA